MRLDVFRPLTAARDDKLKRRNGFEAALVFVDFQNDFCTDGGVAWRRVQNKEAMARAVEAATSLASEARQMGMPCVFVRSFFDQKYKFSTLLRKHAELGIHEEICKENTWGADFYGPQPSNKDLTITKHTDDAFLYTSLEAMLRNYRIHTIVLVGVFAEICILETAKSAHKRGFEVIVPSDCVAGMYDGCVSAALTEMSFIGVRVVDSVESPPSSKPPGANEPFSERGNVHDLFGRQLPDEDRLRN